MLHHAGYERTKLIILWFSSFYRFCFISDFLDYVFIYNQPFRILLDFPKAAFVAFYSFGKFLKFIKKTFMHVALLWPCCAVVIINVELTKPKLRLCTGLYPTHNLSEIWNGANFWQLPQLEIRLNVFSWSTIPRKKFIIIHHYVFFIYRRKPLTCINVVDLDFS